MPKSTRARKIKRSRSSYKCTCWRFCRAPPDGKVVSKTTYHSHKEQRELEKGVRLEDLENRRSRQKSTIARSRWQEEKREVDKVRRARNVKISLVGQIRYAEVLYYFNVIKENTRFTLAVITTFSPPNAEILQKSFKTLKVCSEGDSVTIIDAKWIIEVVGMIPFQQPGLAWDNKEEADQYFVLEKLYSNVVVHAEDDEEEI
ncbi:hypothetical protein E1B28_006874 [Marasmius oreades]|uniref:Uncharacterized protein n=1 Tax=Marasmius oreades TaxID=181124 RepID=A0A9P7UTG3_9AGAR|nr:uncharacterized protein E1B28_006874 [Marasmius oreades]KAG7093185.1 hypothetical protein E1B28_006874 [Marasmius oreades]